MEDDYLIELGGVENGRFRRNEYILIDEAFDDQIINFLDRLNNIDAYYSIYTYQDDDIENCLLRAPLYIDLDLEIEKEADFKKTVQDTLMVVSYLEEEFGIEEHYIQIYFSGSKGFHVIVDPEILGVEPSATLNEELKIVASEIKKHTIHKTVDTSIYDRRRLFRFPNSVNSKTGLYKVPIRLEDLRRINYDDMKKYASRQREVDLVDPELIKSAQAKFKEIIIVDKIRKTRRRHAKNSRLIIPTERKDLLPCVKQILDEGIGKGMRDNTSVAIASSMLQSGIEKSEVEDEMMAWNEKNDPPLPESDIRKTINSAFSLAKAGRGYGCTFFKDNDFCVGNTCSLFRE